METFRRARFAWKPTDPAGRSNAMSSEEKLTLILGMLEDEIRLEIINFIKSKKYVSPEQSLLQISILMAQVCAHLLNNLPEFLRSQGLSKEVVVQK
jgi:hypothetical protein